MMTGNGKLRCVERKDEAFSPPLLVDALKRILADVKTPFSMPGHRGGRGFPVSFSDMVSEIDTTELPGTDNLQHPQTILKAAQERAAVHFGAVSSHFLVNGSTVGLLAMLQAVAGPGDEILVGRDCHRSVLHAIQLTGAEPIFIGNCPDGARTMPAGTGFDGTLPFPAGTDSDKSMPIPGGPSEAQFMHAIQNNPQAKALLLTRPNYYGVAVPLENIAFQVHAQGMVLLVDEAHGAHFNNSPLFPKPALACGADLVVQSLHKTLPSPTQTAMLHEGVSWQGVRSGLSVSSVREAISLFQTTSPSYPLLAGMDAAIRWASESGREAYRNLFLRLDACRSDIERETRFHLLRASDLPFGVDLDPTRLVIQAKNHGMQLEAWLREKHGLFAEMADLHQVVLIATPFHDEADFVALIDALRDVPLWEEEQAVHVQKCMEQPVEADMMNVRVMSFHEAVRARREQVPLTVANGRVSARAVVPYPPGVAAIVPGERYGAELVSRLLEQEEKGISLLGMEDGCVSCIMEGQ